ncbi:MAG: hypothetical protein JG765_1521 [Cereibacter sp.]|jgi:hypothetical protein|nr:hypothetical protein [Cereibacter sp.]
MIAKIYGGAFAAILFGTAAMAQDVYVDGYTRSDGTYVSPHYRSAPNETKSDNWSQQGNVNPYTGAPGTKDCSPFCANTGGSQGYGNSSAFGQQRSSGSSLFGN